MRDFYAPAGSGSNVVYVEAAHHAAVQMQADDSRPIARDARDVNMIGIRYKAGHCTGLQQDDAAANQFDAVIRISVRRQAHVAALLENAFNHADDTPTPVVVYGSPLAGEPHQRIE